VQHLCGCWRSSSSFCLCCAHADASNRLAADHSVLVVGVPLGVGLLPLLLRLPPHLPTVPTTTNRLLLLLLLLLLLQGLLLVTQRQVH
jgi:hypothetical protein